MSKKATENNITTAALEPIASEIMQEISRVDYFLAAVGNGSSLLGPARIFRAHSPNTKIVAYEPFQSGVAFERHKPGEYKTQYVIKNGDLPPHHVFGMSYRGIPFPHIRLSFREGLVDETWLVSDKETDSNYHQETGRRLDPELPRWDDFKLPYGRSTHCGLAVAFEIAKREEDKNIVLLAYDKADRYDR